MLAGKYAEDDVKQKEEEEKGDDAHGDENTVKKKQCASVNIGIKKGKKLGSGMLMIAKIELTIPLIY